MPDITPNEALRLMLRGLFDKTGARRYVVINPRAGERENGLTYDIKTKPFDAHKPQQRAI